MRRGLVLLTAGMVAAVAAVGGVAQAEVTDAEPVLHDGDLLLRNHSFEDGLTGWSPTNGRGGEPTPPCRDAVTTTTEWASDGSRALLLPGRPPCRRVGAVSSSVSVSPGQHYTAFAHVHADKAATIRLRWLDEQGRVVSVSSSTTRRGSDVAEVSASVPAAAREVQVELAAADRALFDQVLITAPLTVLDRQITKGTSYLSMAAGVDENGRAVTYAVGTGSEHDPAVLTVTDILTGEVVRNVRLPGATGAWGIRQNPVTGTVYVGTYSAPALWLYTPGASEAVRVGAPPIEAWGFMYDIDFDDDGVAYGGGWGEPTDGFAGAAVYRYVEGEGFQGTLGPNPLVTDAYYSRTVAYEEQTKTVFVGTGTKPHLVGCSTVGEPRCKDFIGLFSEKLQASPWVYGITAGNGYVMAWAGDSQSLGDDNLVILRVWRDDADELQAEVVAEVEGVIYNGSSPVVDGKVYYSKANDPGQPLYAFDLATREEVTMPNSNTGIFSRRWEAVELDDPAWPGTTLVGWNSGAYLVKYNLDTHRLERTKVEGIPDVSLQVHSITEGPDGRIWSAGYLTGGLGGVAPMRDDEHVTFAVGGQAEAMISYRGRVYQGTYPYARIESFTYDEVASGETPRIDCTIGAGQNRPYGLLGHGDRIYYGTQAEYGHNEGAFGWLDLATGECTTLDGVVGHQSVNTIAASGDKVFGGGSIFYSWDGLPIEDQAKLLIFDESRQEARTTPWPIPNTRAVNAAVTDQDGVVWFYAEGWLLALDPTTEEWIHREHIFPDWKPGDRVAGNYGQMVVASDGWIYGNVGGRVFGFDPRRTLAQGSAADTLTILTEGTGPYLTLDAYDNLYVTYRATALLRIDPRPFVREASRR